MPKILINEKDITSPGTPDSYANYAVLIAGLIGRDPVTTKEADSFNTANAEKIKLGTENAMVADAIQADANGVYEFSSAQAFKDTIGLVAPKQETKNEHTIYHYGNQMAYELLNMGYSIVYLPLSPDHGSLAGVTPWKIADLADAKTWEIFKDKASYDFRFITHGLLESSEIVDTEGYAEAKNKLALVEAAIKELKRIAEETESEVYGEAGDIPNKDFEATDAQELKYTEIRNNYEGFKHQFTDSTSVYDDYAAAVLGTDEDKKALEEAIADYIGDGITSTFIHEVNANIAKLAEYEAKGANNTNDMSAREIQGRGDCVALIEIDEKQYVQPSSNTKAEDLIIQAIKGMGYITASGGKFCAVTVPSVYYAMNVDKDKPNEFGNNVKFPGSFHYLACFINSLKLGFAEWYAAAGYTRGVANYVIDHTSVKFGEIAINALEPRNIEDQSSQPRFACNVIANFRGSYYLWGNRTAHLLGKKGSLTDGDLTASSFLNIRQLCSTIKKQLYVSCRSFTFDPNSDTLWINFVNAIRPTLDAMKADQGIRDYKIVKLFTDKKATLKAKIRIIPIEAVEDFDLEVSLEDSFGETDAVVTE